MTLMFRESIYSSLVTIEDNHWDGCLKTILWDGLWKISQNEKVSQSAISQNKAEFRNLKKDVVTMTKKQREDKEAKIEEASLNSSPRKAASPLATACVSCHLIWLCWKVKTNDSNANKGQEISSSGKYFHRNQYSDYRWWRAFGNHCRIWKKP